jgi:2,4-dienoyl-CoA reductase-like NADH-dependent reductase (Old Yellow Enzyme family)
LNLLPSTPTLFTPLTIRNVTLRNRIIVAPMCQYSCAVAGELIGSLTDHHVATLGHYALKGAAVVFIEATNVQPHGRITPNCPGLWDDAQIPGIRRVAEFVKSQGALMGLQIGHAGRKASTIATWLSERLQRPSTRADVDVGGWPNEVVGPMGGPPESWDMKTVEQDSGFWPPRQLTVAEIKEIVQAFADSARRGVEAGVDIIEIHSAHGYLLYQFLSPITNRREDEYGGSFENRTRLLFEVIQAVRSVIPDSMPLFLRISSTEWMEHSELASKFGSWDVESTIRVAKELPRLGVDLLDVSSGGNHPQQRIPISGPRDYQTKIAGRIRAAVKEEGLQLLIGAVGLITEANQARDLVEVNESIEQEAATAKRVTDAKGKVPMADVVLIARQFMREPEWVLRIAHQLGVDVAWPSQFHRVRFSK